MASIGRVLVMIAMIAAVTPVVGPAPAHAAGPGITVLRNVAADAFPTRLTFSLQAQSAVDIASVRLAYQVGDEPITRIARATFVPGPRVSASYQIDLRQTYLPPGVAVQYVWQIQDQSSAQLTTPPARVVVGDPRFSWRTQTLYPVTLHYHDVDDQYAHVLLDTAAQALANASVATGVRVIKPVQVYVYGNEADLQAALGAGVDPWVGGQAFPTYRVTLLYTPLSDVVTAQQSVAHEMTHLDLDGASDDPLGPLPTWLDEGLAMVVSARDIDPTFAQALQNAARDRRLLSLQSLSGTFPEDPGQATLAYAESDSAVRYFERQYGQPKLIQLIDAFHQGETSGEAFRATVGVTPLDFQNAWETSVGAGPTSVRPPGKGGSIIQEFSSMVDSLGALIQELLRSVQTKGGPGA